MVTINTISGHNLVFQRGRLTFNLHYFIGLALKKKIKSAAWNKMKVQNLFIELSFVSVF